MARALPRGRCLVCALVAVWVAVACDDDVAQPSDEDAEDFVAPPGGPPASLQNIAGDAQTGVRRTALPESLVVRVLDSKNQPVPNVWVRWLDAEEFFPSVSPESSLTNSAGDARGQWHLSHRVGTQWVRASVAHVSDALFTATAGPGPPSEPPPVLTITSPANHSVARPRLSVAASCVASGPSCVITARAVQPGTDTLVATGKGSVDQEISLSVFDGESVTLVICAEDQSGLTWPSCAGREIYVDTSPHLKEAGSVPAGLILDADSNRVAFSSDTTAILDYLHDPTDPLLFCQVRFCAGRAPPPLMVLERATSQTQQITAETVGPGQALLTPPGVVFWLLGDQSRWYEWRSGVTTDLGAISGPTVRGSYAVWNTSGSVPDGSSHLIRRDLVAGTNVTVATYGSGEGVTSIGDVVYQAIRREDDTDLRTFQIVRYSNGVRTKLTADTLHNNTLPSTDGTNVAYLKQTGGLTGPLIDSKLMLIQPSGEITVYEGFTTAPVVKDGWLFYYRQIGNRPHLWARSPAGEQMQVTSFNTFSGAVAFGDGGEVLLLNGDRLYVTTPGFTSPATAVMSNQWQRVYHENGKFYAAIGRSLFEILP